MTHKMQVSVAFFLPYFISYIYLLQRNYCLLPTTELLLITAIFYTLFDHPRNDPQNAVISLNFLPYFYTYIYTHIFVHFAKPYSIYTFTRWLSLVILSFYFLESIQRKKKDSNIFYMHILWKPYSIYSLTRRQALALLYFTSWNLDKGRKKIQIYTPSFLSYIYIQPLHIYYL